MANNIDKVRIIIVGDSGVGKTCLTHLIAHNESLAHDGWTVGCNIEVKLHEYKEGTPLQKPYFIELFDIGGSLSHKNTRSVFYTPTHGIVLVHDLTNRKSHENLREWLYEILNKEGKDTYKPTSNSSLNASGTDTFDPEQFMGAAQIPILVVGTKIDLIDEKRLPSAVQRTGGIAEQCGAEEIWLNCRNPNSLSAGTTDAVKLARFFDRVIEKKIQSRDGGVFHHGTDRRRLPNLTSPFTSPESSLLSSTINSPTVNPKSPAPATNRTFGNVLMENSGLQ